ncbi:MAG TPA: Rieske (2Fe-2S) protein [Mycobacteriales bacterium]|nr:Rieske (2Fe-2S) protein [Mycobacteriales bacterium]
MSLDDVSRRSVLRGCALAAAGGVAGFLVARRSDAAGARPATAAANGYGPAASTPAGNNVLTTVSAVPAGGGVVLGKSGVVVTKDAGGAVHAFSATCTHQGCTVSSVSGGTINCPCHGSRFDADTGAVVQGPATRPLPTVAVTVQGDQIVRG